MPTPSIQSINQSRLLTEQEAASFLAVTTRTMRRYRDANVIPFIRLGGTIRYDRIKIQRALDQLEVGSA